LKCAQFLSGQRIDCFYGSHIVITWFTHPVTRQNVEQVTSSLHTHTPNLSDQAYASFWMANADTSFANMNTS